MTNQTTDTKASEDTTRTSGEYRKSALDALYRSLADAAEAGDAHLTIAYAQAIEAVLAV